MLDTEHAEAALRCNVTTHDMRNAFGLHDNDLGSHIFVPYVLSLFIGPWPSIVLAYLFESMAVLEEAYDTRIIGSVFTGPVDGLLQDPLAGIIGAMVLTWHAYVFGGRRKIRDAFLAPYKLGWTRDHVRANAAFLFFTVLPIAMGHNVYEWMGADRDKAPLRVWTMCLNWIVPLAHALYVGSTRTDGFTCIGMTYVLLFLASLASYVGAREDAADPLQSTYFWALLILEIDNWVLWYRKRTGHKFTLLR